MAFTRDDLLPLEAAIKSGTLSVRYNDRTVQYQSIKDMLAARRQIIAEVDLAEGIKPKRGRIFRLFQQGRG